ncbi:MAG: PHP domain-containing protein [Candidatus Eisenbacteria bacterium]|nr:PHP domain-containing protein [Candidatus Eisenbacteria bacterium]
MIRFGNLIVDEGQRSGADLHLHSYYSDGVLSPRSVLTACAEAGLAAAALTDHDTVEGLEEAELAARDLGLELVPGCELSLEYAGQDLHLLGYSLDRRDERLRVYLKAMEGRRRERIERIAERLQALGVPLAVDAILAQAGGAASVGRPHVARALVEAGFVESYHEAFVRYLADGAPAHVPKETASLAEAMAVLQEAGGCVVLAHPGLYELEAVLPPLERAGLAGLEVYHPAHNSMQVSAFEDLVAQKGWVATGGSDFHRDEGNGPGRTIGSLRVKLEVVRELQRRAF